VSGSHDTTKSYVVALDYGCKGDEKLNEIRGCLIAITKFFTQAQHNFHHDIVNTFRFKPEK
jgi:hypothetical protein